MWHFGTSYIADVLRLIRIFRILLAVFQIGTIRNMFLQHVPTYTIMPSALHHVIPIGQCICMVQNTSHVFVYTLMCRSINCALLEFHPYNGKIILSLTARIFYFYCEQKFELSKNSNCAIYNESRNPSECPIDHS